MRTLAVSQLVDQDGDRQLGSHRNPRGRCSLATGRDVRLSRLIVVRAKETG